MIRISITSARILTSWKSSRNLTSRRSSISLLRKGKFIIATRTSLSQRQGRGRPSLLLSTTVVSARSSAMRESPDFFSLRTGKSCCSRALRPSAASCEIRPSAAFSSDVRIIRKPSTSSSLPSRASSLKISRSMSRTRTTMISLSSTNSTMRLRLLTSHSSATMSRRFFSA